MRKKLALLSLLMLGLGPGLSGCALNAPPLPAAISPEVSSEVTSGEAVIPTAGAVSPSEFQFRSPRLGRFNIHKRHGLGGWEGGSPHGTERELLRGMSRTE